LLTKKPRSKKKRAKYSVAISDVKRIFHQHKEKEISE
jgi:hypothetical protein